MELLSLVISGEMVVTSVKQLDTDAINPNTENALEIILVLYQLH